MPAPPQKLTLKQSQARYQARLRTNPRLDSVWVENPMNRQELILVDPKTGRLRGQGAKDEPIVLPRGISPSQTRFDPPCSLPKLVPYQGPTRGIFINIGDGKDYQYTQDCSPVLVPAPEALSLTLDQAFLLGLLDRQNQDYNRSLCLQAESASQMTRAAYAMTYPLVQAFAAALDGLDKALMAMAEGKPTPSTSSKPRL